MWLRARAPSPSRRCLPHFAVAAAPALGPDPRNKWEWSSTSPNRGSSATSGATHRIIFRTYGTDAPDQWRPFMIACHKKRTSAHIFRPPHAPQQIHKMSGWGPKGGDCAPSVSHAPAQGDTRAARVLDARLTVGLPCSRVDGARSHALPSLSARGWSGISVSCHVTEVRSARAARAEETQRRLNRSLRSVPASQIGPETPRDPVQPT